MAGEHSDGVRNSDPKVVGPGVWFSIHTLAMAAVTEDKKRNFQDYMVTLSIKFPCGKCRGHIREYLNSNPISDYWNVKSTEGVEIGLFQWSWIFHNFVNARLNKPQMDWGTAYSLYMMDNSDVCTGDCASPPSSPTPSSPTPSSPTPSPNPYSSTISSSSSTAAPVGNRSFKSSPSSPQAKKPAVSGYGIPYRMRRRT